MIRQMIPPAVESDVQLLSRWVASRDAGAFGHVARRHVDAVYAGAVRQLGVDDRPLADDVTQAVFLVLSDRADQATRASSVAGVVAPGDPVRNLTHFAQLHINPPKRAKNSRGINLPSISL
jgi:hypothetical protein